jgi:DNA primase
MQDTAKYLIHADITTDGIVERSDVVGAVFGQTEGLLGDELDLRELQDSSKVGRIDVDVDSENGQSFGRMTIATSLDQVETAILAAALETIDRVGPCRSTIEVRRIEDVRAARRREVVERAKTLLTEAFDGSMRSSRDLVEEVREAVRVEDITEYEGLPAGPNVADSDAIVVVEGRADVLTLLRYGVKNAIAAEGTDVPDAVGSLTEKRTVTAFLDGDRGGELVLKELAQVGEVDYVAFAPEDRSVEDLDRRTAMAALREKVPYHSVADLETPSDLATDAGAVDGTGAAAVDVVAGDEPGAEPAADGSDANGTDVPDAVGDETTATPETLPGHVRAVVEGETNSARLLDAEFRSVAEGDAEEAFDLVADAAEPPAAVVLDGEVDQRLLDVAAQRGVEQVVAASTGEFVKRPTSVRVRTAEQLLAANEA